VDLPPTDDDYRNVSWLGARKAKSAIGINLPKLERHLDRPNIQSIKVNSFFIPSFGLPEEFGLIYVDGGHDYPVVAWDIMFAYNHLAKDGFMFMHDYGQAENNHVHQVVEYMAKRIPEQTYYLPSKLTKKGMTPCVWKGHK
jgi:hypothetical protein